MKGLASLCGESRLKPKYSCAVRHLSGELDGKLGSPRSVPSAAIPPTKHDSNHPEGDSRL